MRHIPHVSRTLLSTIIAACAATGAYAQNDEAVEEVLVSGVRSAQEKAIDIKRNSAEIVDSISAEDIGKLPDSTIADSLQRVTGIQIQRSAGQGALVSIRGSREVLSTLNGELFLTAENILNSQADYRDVPSALISGSNVSKSMNAKQLEGGIGGTVDLLTRRALTLDEGLSSSVRLQASEGSITKKTDPELSGLLGYNWNDQAAMSLAFSYADQTVSDNTVQTKAADNAQDESWGCNCDANADGDKSDRYLIMSNWDGPRLYKNDTERERLGLAYNFNAQLNDSFELNVDSFYNTMDEVAAGNYLMLSDEAVDYDRARITELYGITPVNQEDMFAQFYTTGWKKQIDGSLRGGVNSDYRDTSASNNNLELKYDGGGAFTGSLRYVTSKAKRDTSNLILAQKADSPGGADGLAYNIAGDKRVVNPGFIDDRYDVTFNAHSTDVSVGFDPTLASRLADPAAWYFHSGWLEGEHQEVSLDVLRADGSFKFEDQGITSIDFGVRFSDREASRSQVHYFMPTGVNAYNPATGDEYEMLVKYHEAGYTPYFVPQGAIWDYRIQTGAEQNPATDPRITFEPVRGVNLDDSHVLPYLRQVTDFGAGVKGMDVSIPMINVGKVGDHVGFMDRLYDTTHVMRERPHRSYHIEEARESFYISANFSNDLSDSLTLSGNVGVRRVTDTITVTRNLIDTAQMDPDVISGRDANHTNFVDLGDVSTVVSHSHFLPSLNATLAIEDSYKVRFSYDERTSLQPLNNFGEGTDVSYGSQIELPDGSRYQPIGSVKEGGNPYLNPWSASVYNLGFEWYPADNALLGMTLFYMDIGGFTDTETKNAPLADSDGVVRNGATIERLINGKNATVEGAEFSYQQSFDFLPGFLANTGITWNYTYSPSEKEGQKLQFDGSEIPFNSTAKNQSNLVLWYNDDRFEFRVAANYLGKKYDGQATPWTVDPLKGDPEEGLVGGLDRWEDETVYIDLSSTYHINEQVNLSLNVQNLTEEDSIKYLHWEQFRSEYYSFERRITLGLNAKF